MTVCGVSIAYELGRRCVMRVKLIRKLAERIDGIDLSGYQPGDILDLTREEAALLVAEGWAVRESGVSAVERQRQYTSLASHTNTPRVRAADRPRAVRRVKARLRRWR